MKKTIIKITAITVFSFISFTALAQNAANKKPTIDESNKTTEAPQIVPVAKELKTEEQVKPIVPGGEFKPRDTNKQLTNNTKTEPAEKVQPTPQLPAVKKADPPPVVTEQHADPSAQDRAKPAPVQVILQKQ